MSTPYSDAPEAGAPTIVGLDLSLASTGVARIENSVATVTRVTSRPTVNDSSRERVRRLTRIVAFLRTEVPCGSTVAVEGPAFGSNDPGAHMRAGLWWMVCEMLETRGCDVYVIAPSTLKKYATGRGNAKKDEVLAAVIRRYSDVDVKGNDESDALVLAAMCARHLGHPIDDVPQASLDAMKSVKR